MFRSLRLSVHDLVLLIGVVTLMVLQMTKFADDPGVGWHLKNGEYIAEHGIPYTDPFLSVPIGQELRPWVSDQWLSDLIIYKLKLLGDWRTIYLFLTIIYVFTFMFVVYRGLRGAGCPAVASSVATLFAFKLAEIHFILRPVVFSFLLFAFAFVLIRKLATSTGDAYRRAFRHAIIILPPLFLVWSNLHPAFMVGLMLLALLPGSRILASLLDSQLQNKFWKQEVVLLLLCAGVTLINPYGATLHSSIAALGQSSFFMNFHQEWLSPDFKAQEGQFFEFIVGIILIAGFLNPKFRSGIAIFDILAAIVFGHFALQMVRFLPFFGIVVAPTFAMALAAIVSAPLWNQFPIIARLVLAGEWIEARQKGASNGLLGGLLALAFLVFFWRYDPLPLGPTTAYPKAALGWLGQYGSATGTTVVSVPDWGGYITLAGYPRFRAIIDDRNTLLGEDFYRQYFSAMKDPARISQYLASFGATYLLLPKSGEIAGRQSCNSELQQIYADDVAIVLKKRE